jgi:hypothetical protein
MRLGMLDKTGCDWESLGELGWVLVLTGKVCEVE